jgi:hypothetical protein
MFKIGDIVQVNPDNDNDNYDSFRNKYLEIIHVANSVEEHPGYDSGVGQALYDLKDTETGDLIDSSLYEYELTLYARCESLENEVEAFLKKYNMQATEKDEVEAIRVIGKTPCKADMKRLKELKPKIIKALNQIEQEKEEKKKAEKELKLKTIEDIKAGKKKIVCVYHDGEYYSGHTASIEACELLEKIELAKYLDGWGMTVNYKLVEELGTEFTYQEAYDYIKPELEKKERLKLEKELERKRIFDKARNTGEKQLLDKYVTDCNDRHEQCSTDIVYQYAMPDGTVTTERVHTY